MSWPDRVPYEPAVVRVTLAGAAGRPKPGKTSVIARVLAAVIGAYCASWTYTASLSLVLFHAGLERSNAVAWATLSSFVVYLALALWCFVDRSVLRIWLSLTGLTAVLALAARMMGAA